MHSPQRKLGYTICLSGLMVQMATLLLITAGPSGAISENSGIDVDVKYNFQFSINNFLRLFLRCFSILTTDT